MWGADWNHSLAGLEKAWSKADGSVSWAYLESCSCTCQRPVCSSASQEPLRIDHIAHRGGVHGTQRPRVLDHARCSGRCGPRSQRQGAGDPRLTPRPDGVGEPVGGRLYVLVFPDPEHEPRRARRTSPSWCWHDPDEQWNGWACPALPAAEAQRVAEALADRDGGQVTWDGQTLVLLLPDCEDAEVCSPDARGLYPLGAGSWTWSTT